MCPGDPTTIQFPTMSKLQPNLAPTGADEREDDELEKLDEVLDQLEELEDELKLLSDDEELDWLEELTELDELLLDPLAGAGRHSRV